MNTNEILNRVKFALGILETPVIEEVKLSAEAMLIDGTKISADALEVGNIVSTVSEDGSLTTATEGIYESNEFVYTVDANGTITGIEPKVEEVEVTEVEETPEVETPEVGMEEMLTALEALVSEMSAMKAKLAELEANQATANTKMEAFSKAPATSKIKNTPSSLYEFSREAAPEFDKKLSILKEIKSNTKN
jgi:hypothetical protein